MTVVTLDHLRRLGYCAPHIRAWCRRHGIPLSRLRHGIPVAEARATGCPFAARAADLAEQEAQDGA